MPPTVATNPSGEDTKLGPLDVPFLLTDKDTNGRASVFEARVPAGQKLATPVHRNDAFEEILYGIAGVVTRTIDESSAGGPPDVAKMVEVFHRYGMTVAAPPVPAGR